MNKPLNRTRRAAPVPAALTMISATACSVTRREDSPFCEATAAEI